MDQLKVCCHTSSHECAMYDSYSNMFCITYTTCKMPSTCAPNLPSTPGSHGMVHLLLLLCGVQHTRYNALSVGMTEQFSRVCPWWHWLLALTFKFIRARDQTRLPCEFGINPFSSSQRYSSDKQKNRTLSQTVLKTVPYMHAVIMAVITLCMSGGHGRVSVTAEQK